MTRRIFVIILSAITAGITAFLALFQKNLGQGISVLLGYVILLISSVLMNLCIAGSTDDTKRTALLVFSIGILVFFIGGIIHVLFSSEHEVLVAAPSVVESEIPESQLQSTDDAAAKANYEIPDNELEEHITPTITELPAEMDDEPFSSYREDYSIEIGTFQSPNAAAVQDKPEIPSSPSVFNTITSFERPAPDMEIIDLDSSASNDKDTEPVIPLKPEPDENTIRVSAETPSSPSVFNTITSFEWPVPAVEVIDLDPSLPVSQESSIASDQTAASSSYVPETALVPETSVAEESVATSAFSAEKPEEDIPTAFDRAEDFWSTFYIAGEDELLLDDGVYYMTLVINNNEVGSITTLVEGGVASINSAELKDCIDGAITDEAENRIFFGNKEYLSESDLISAGVDAVFDNDSYLVTLNFSVSDMPVQILSVRGVSRGSLRRLPISGATVLDPAVFSWATRYTLSGNFRILPTYSFANSLRFTFRTDNRLRLYDLFLDFDYALRFSLTGVQFDWGSYEFHYDFPDQMIRLSWGNISSELLSPSGTDIGIRFDKAIEYGGPDTTRKSHVERIISIDTESDVQIFNEGREIFRRTLSPGNYSLRDFVLYTGVNKIRIVVTPLDGSPATETEIDLVYASSLLAPGEVYFGGALTTGRSIVDSDSDMIPGAVRIPWFNKRSLEYDARNISVGGYVQAGLTESLTMDASLAFMNRVSTESFFIPSFATALELTHANILGTTRYNLNITEESDDYGNFLLPDIYARVGHQVFTGWRPLNSMNFGLSYDTDLANRPDRHSFMLSSSFSGTVGILGWGLSLSGTIRTDSITEPLYSASLSLSLSAARNVYMSAGLSVSGVGLEAPSIYARASATIRFSPARATVSASSTRLSADVDMTAGDHSLSVSVDTTPAEIASFDSYSFDAGYSYSGDKFNASANIYGSDSFNTLTGNFSLSTSSVFADGLMAFNSYIPSNYILVSQHGALKGNEVSVGAVGSSMSNPLDTFFGVGLYTGLSLNRASSLSVYSFNSNSFGSSTSFDVAIPASRRNGYVLHLTADNKYSLSGVVELPDGSIWRNGSSPVYMITIEDDSVSTLGSEYYVFTDDEGRFVISDLMPGRYAFDVPYDGGWILYSFAVEENEEHAVDIQLLENPEREYLTLPDVYSSMYTFDNGPYITGDDFWAMLYPEMQEAV